MKRQNATVQSAVENTQLLGTPWAPSRLWCRLSNRFLTLQKVLKKLQFPPARHGLRPAVHVELAIDVLQVLFDRARGDDQPAGDLFVREAFGEQSQHLQLALGERVSRRFGERGRQGSRLRCPAPLRRLCSCWKASRRSRT